MWRGALANGAARLMAVALTAVQVAFLTRQLNLNEYGLVVSLSFLGISGLVGAAIGTRIGNAFVREPGAGPDDNRILWLSALQVTTIAAAGVVFAIVCAWPFVPWRLVLNTGDPALIAAASRGLLIGVSCQAAAVPLGLAAFGFRAYQETEAIAAQTAATAVLTLALAWAGAAMLHSLAIVIAAPFLAFALTSAAASAVWIARRRWHLEWLPIAEAWRHASGHVRGAIQFAALGGLAGLVTSSVTYFVSLTQGFGHAALADFYLKLLAVVLLAHSEMMHPLWPAYAERRPRGETVWTRRAIGISIAGGAALVAVATGLIGTGGAGVIKWLTALDAPVSGRLLIALAAYGIAYAVAQALATYLTATGQIMPQLRVWGTGAIVLAVASIQAGRVWGPAGGVAGAAAGLGVVAAGLAVLVARDLRPRVGAIDQRVDSRTHSSPDEGS